MDYDFNTADVKLDTAGLPAGTYKVMIKSEEIVEKDNIENPKILNVNFEVVEGELKGKSHKQTYSLWHSKPVVVNIAKQNLKKIAIATGREVSAQAPLKGRVLVIVVSQQKKSDFMEITKYLNVDAIHNDAEVPA